jgi:methylenetetrahydrofolate reductase (NADPH)
VDRARAVGIKVPIIPGVKPVTTVRQLATIPREFHVDLPEELVMLINRAETPAEATRCGIEFTVALCRGLLKADAPGLHFYTMGRGRAVTEVLMELSTG